MTRNDDIEGARKTKQPIDSWKKVMNASKQKKTLTLLKNLNFRISR